MEGCIKRDLLHGAAWKGLDIQATPKSRVVYLSAEGFLSAFVAALNPGGTAIQREWKKRGKPVRPA